MSIAVVRHRFSVEDYERMIATGVLTENDRVELIRGEIVDKMTIGDRHLACVNRLNRLLTSGLRNTAIISVQNPIRLEDSRPEPDVAVLRDRDDFYATATPTPADVLLLIEVADSSVAFDREAKGPLYAESGVAEYWLVDLAGGVVEVYRDPREDGTYGGRSVAGRGSVIAPLARPDLALAVDDLLGPR